MDILIKTTQLILSLSILIIFHELGHFIPAKIFKTRVERFFLFFDPWFSLFKKKIGDTIYGIGWIPLGGYIKIAGIINENIYNGENNSIPNYLEFRSKKSWQRLIIMLGGVLTNILLSIIIFTSLLFISGETFLPVKNMKYGVVVNDIGLKIGIKNGDMIEKIDDKKVINFTDIPKGILLGNNISINRNGKIINLKIDNIKKRFLFDRKELGLFIAPRLPVIIESVYKKSEAYTSGLKTNDKILAINSHYNITTDQINKILNKYSEKSVKLLIDRNGKYIKKIIKINKKGIIGVNIINNINKALTIDNRIYSLSESIYYGILKSWHVFIEQISFFKQIFNTNTNAYKQVGSIFSMVRVFSPKWDWNLFWIFTANLSIWLSFINILPIPTLDGGHTLFILLEILLRRKINENLIDKINSISFIIMIIIMIIIISWDTFKNFIL